MRRSMRGEVVASTKASAFIAVERAGLPQPDGMRLPHVTPTQPVSPSSSSTSFSSVFATITSTSPFNRGKDVITPSSSPSFIAGSPRAAPIEQTPIQTPSPQSPQSSPYSPETRAGALTGTVTTTHATENAVSAATFAGAESSRACSHCVPGSGKMRGHGGAHKQHASESSSESRMLTLSLRLHVGLGAGGGGSGSDGGGGSPIGGSHGEEEAKIFAAGSRIEAQFGGGDDWFAGRVRKVNRNGSFDIDYDDGDEERNVTVGCMRTEGSLPMFIEDGSDTGTGNASCDDDQSGEGSSSDMMEGRQGGHGGDEECPLCPPGSGKVAGHSGAHKSTTRRCRGEGSWGRKRALEDGGVPGGRLVVNGNGNGKESNDIINSGNRNRNRDRNRDRNHTRSNGGKLRVVGKVPVQAAPLTKVASEMSLESILALNARAPKKPRKGSIGGSSGSKGGGRAVAKEVKSTWVQCEEPACLKWRMIPASVDDADLPEVFRCSMNRWDPSQASCAVPEAGLKAGETETAAKVKKERRKKKEVVLDPSTARCMTKAGQAWWQRTLAGL